MSKCVLKTTKILAAAPRAHPFTAPAVIPCTKYLCSRKKTRSGTDIEMNAPDASRFHSEPYWPEQALDGDREGELVQVLQQDKRVHQVVPDPDELEDPQGGQGGNGQRKHDGAEDAELGLAVHLGRLEELPRKLREEVAQQKDREGQPVRGVGKPDGQEVSR